MSSICYDLHNLISNEDLIIKKENFVFDLNHMYSILYDDFNNKKAFQFETLEKDFVNPKLIFRDVLTDFIVKDYLLNNTENTLIDIINKVMKGLFKAYYDYTGYEVIFIYRGGNILNLYKTKYDKMLPSPAREILESEFNQYFKKSDLDFFLVIKNHLKFSDEELNHVNRDIQSLTDYGLSVSRDIILSNPYIFKFCQYNIDYLNLIFGDVLDEINTNIKNSPIDYVKNLNYIGIGFNKYFYNRSNINPLDIPFNKQEFIFDDGNKSVYDNFIKYRKSGKFDVIVNTDYENNILNIFKQNYIFDNLFFKYNFGNLNKKIVEENNNYMDLYISNNLNILDVDKKIHFRLSRIMINFTLLYETKNKKYGIVNVPSELYDVSLSNKYDRSSKIFPFNAFRKYFYSVGNITDYIYIPKIETLIKDLDLILFNNLPWNDPKYKKRLFRMLIMIFIDTLYYKDIYRTRDDIIKFIDNIPLSRSDNLDFAYIQFQIENIKNIIKDDPEQKQLYNEFINYIMIILNKLLNVVEKYKQYVLKKGKIDDLLI